MASRASRASKRKTEDNIPVFSSSASESSSSVSTSTKQIKTPEQQPAEPAVNNETKINESLAAKRAKLLSVPSISLEALALQPGRDPSNAVNVAVSSRALFDLGMDYNWMEEPSKFAEYLKGVIEDEATPFPPGAALPFIQALCEVNRCLMAIDPEEQERFNVILMSHNHAHVGIKLINSINHHELHIERMCLTGGTTPVPDYLAAYKVSLFLTSYPEEVEKALECGFAAAAMSSQAVKNCPREELRVAFDLDAVLFSAESEVQYKTGGLKAFFKHERANADKLVEEGPLKRFAQALGRMQQKFKDNQDIVKKSPIKIYIVTARSAASAGERAIKTLRAWGLIIDQIHFLAGAPKGPILKAIKPHIFFDDQHTHIVSAQEYGISAAQVPNTIERQMKMNKSFQDVRTASGTQ